MEQWASVNRGLAVAVGSEVVEANDPPSQSGQSSRASRRGNRTDRPRRRCPMTASLLTSQVDAGKLDELIEPRSNRREVRNPVLALPSVQRLLALPPDQRQVIHDILADLVVDARSRAQTSWRQNKGPMAAYWKAVGAYAHHFRRLVAAKPRRKTLSGERHG